MKVIVTGGAGFVGSSVVRMLAGELGIDIVNIDTLTYAGNLNSIEMVADKENYKFIRGNVCDYALMRQVIEAERPDVIMHFAAESHVDRSIDGPSAFIQTNVVGTYTLLEVARDYWTRLSSARKKTFRFHHISTDEVYGSLGPHGRFTETTAYAPNSPYSATKAAADHLVRAWHRTYGLPVLVTNCSNNYGPFHFPEKLIPLAILNGLDSKSIPVYGDGQNIRDWLYVEDHARALWSVVTKGNIGEIYNIGGDAERSNLKVVESICDVLDELVPSKQSRRSLITFVADRPGHDSRYAVDATKIKQELGWKPMETFDSGLRKTVQWYLDNRSWWQELRKSRYSGNRLGLSAHSDH